MFGAEEEKLEPKTISPGYNSGKVIDSSTTNLSRAKLAIDRMETILAETIELDSDINVSAQNMEFDRAYYAFDRASRFKSDGKYPEAETEAMRAALIAETALTSLNVTLRQDAETRFDSVEQYMVKHMTHDIDAWAKLKLESARYILKTMDPFDAWKKALNNLLAIRLLIEAHAIAFHSIKYGGAKTSDDSMQMIAAGASSSATLRWIAA